MKYAAIESMRRRYPLGVLCDVLSVSTSGFHEWKDRPACARQLANEKLVSEIRVLHAQSFGAYGSPRIHQSLKQRGRSIGRERIRRLMQENRIVGRHRKKRCRTTDSNHKLPVAANLLQQNFQCESPNRIWLADISYIATDQGFLYLAAMKELCTKKIVGWSMSATIDAQLVIDALTMAYARQKPAAGLIVRFRSRQPTQYANKDSRDQLDAHQIVQSMSRRGNCYDNAPMESFFSSLKGEYLEHQHFQSHAEARAAIFTYVETFYYPVRLHLSIGYRAPNQFESMLKEAA